ncbi:transposase family protein [Halalkalibacillus sediminis]
MERQPHHCPSCGTLTTKVHDYRQQKIRHIQIFGLETKTFY